MTRRIVEEAGGICSGRVLVELEGGYEIKSFADSNYAIIRALLGEENGYEVKGEVRESTDLITCRSQRAVFTRLFRT